MSPILQFASMVAVGLVAGILGGMFGIGGGLVIVPALILFFGLSSKTAQGTSLFAQLMPVAALAVFDYWQQNKINFKAGFFIAMGLFVGTYIGARITHTLSDAAMKRAYAIFLMCVSLYFFYQTRAKP